MSMLTKGEQRSSLFTWPRRSLKLDLRPASVESFNYLKRILYKRLHRVWGVPYWQDETELSVTASSGQPALQVNSTQYRNFEVGALCVVLCSWGSYEIHEIDSLTSTEITLTENLAFTWAAGTEVYPILKGRLDAVVGFEVPVPKIGGLTVEFNEVLDEGITRFLGDASSFPTYNGIPILNIEPDWKVPIKFMISHPYELAQYLGKGLVHSYRDYSDIGIGQRLSIAGKEAIWDFRGFFNEMRGMYGKFWLSSNQHDMVVTAPFGAGDSTLTIQNIEFADYWGSEDVYLLFHFKDHTEICKKVVSVPSSTSITLDEAIGKSCSAEELDDLRVSFLYLSRFDDDKLALKYRVPQTIETVVTAMRVEA